MLYNVVSSAVYSIYYSYHISHFSNSTKIIFYSGSRGLPRPWKSTFDQTLISSVSACIPYLGACDSPGALRWLVALAQHAAQSLGRTTAADLVSRCLTLLERTAKCLRERADVYHHLLRARYDLVTSFINK